MKTNKKPNSMKTKIEIFLKSLNIDHKKCKAICKKDKIIVHTEDEQVEMSFYEAMDLCKGIKEYHSYEKSQPVEYYMKNLEGFGSFGVRKSGNRFHGNEKVTFIINNEKLF